MKYAFIINLAAFLIFIYANDKLADYLSGAMCAAGVLNATIYGKYLIYIKIVNMYFAVIWLIVNHFDRQNEQMPFTKVKFTLIPVVAVFFILEAVLFVMHFSSIDPTVPVSCCNVIFGENTSVVKTFTAENSVLIFAISVVLIIVSYPLKHPAAYTTANILFAASGIMVLIYSVSPYIYELPTHMCPFCILQSGYNHIGYLFYLTLFGGTSIGIAGGVYIMISGQKAHKLKMLSLALNLVYFLLCVWFPAWYFLKNGVWL
jgi:hypothetical protein